MDKTYLSITGLVKHFDKLSVIEDFTLQIGKGEFVCVVGPTGCGKTSRLFKHSDQNILAAIG